MTGDELPYPSLSRHMIETDIGDRVDEDISTPEIVSALSETYHPFFLIPGLPRLRVAGHRDQLCTEYELGALGERRSIASLPVVAAGRPDLTHQEALTRMLEQATPRYERIACEETSVIARFEQESRAPVALVSRGPRASDVEHRAARMEVEGA